MSADEPVRLSLAALRAEFAASTGAERLQPLGLGRVVEGDGALDGPVRRRRGRAGSCDADDSNGLGPES